MLTHSLLQSYDEETPETKNIGNTRIRARTATGDGAFFQLGAKKYFDTTTENPERFTLVLYVQLPKLDIGICPGKLALLNPDEEEDLEGHLNLLELLLIEREGDMRYLDMYHVDSHGRVRIHAWRHYNINQHPNQKPDWSYDDQDSTDPRKLTRYNDSIEEMIETLPSDTPIAHHPFIKTLREKTLDKQPWYQTLVSKFTEPVPPLSVSTAS
ncbi:hypothetical protein GF386_01105 [Candidatus Pacearchaeota archaeon]|nr:hypothetical protein [Candidatus Pacearchaeota archaeon]MBD3282829.1 hypothetical protein [Candidatus Pacearchaeota archaeon]